MSSLARIKAEQAAVEEQRVWMEEQEQDRHGRHLDALREFVEREPVGGITFEQIQAAIPAPFPRPAPIILSGRALLEQQRVQREQHEKVRHERHLDAIRDFVKREPVGGLTFE